MQCIKFLGAFQIGTGTSARCAGIGEAGRECVAFLIQNSNRMFERTHLVDKFWFREERIIAKSALNSVASRLRKALNSTKKLEIELRSDKWSLGVFLQEESLTDTSVLESIYRRLKSGNGEARKLSSRLADVYRGDFLPGHGNRWTIIERERLQAIFVRSALCVTDHLIEEGAHEEAIDNCRLILSHDPLRESVHRRVLILKALNGESTKVRQHYKNLVEFIREECDAAPDIRTQNLYKSLCSRPTRQQLNYIAASELSTG